MRTKIDYGIHVTPIFACMARMENGEPVVVKSDVLKDTTPMCVGFNKKGSILVGDSAWSYMRSEKMRSLKNWDSSGSNSIIEFTRTLGSNKTYYSSHIAREFSSEELLAEVLKKMKTSVRDEDINAVVLTCPTKFDIPQMDALVRAGKLAGFKQVELLQEPIAAAMAYGLNSKIKNGYWVVFDFNEGCFDVSLIKVDDGILKVVDTDGDNYLGDGNLVMAIVDEIILPYLQEEYVIDSILEDEVKGKTLREALKYYAKEAKEQLNYKDEHWLASDLGDIPGEDDEGEEFELDITINQEILRKAIAPIYQRAMDITKDLIQRNNLSGAKLDALILVGGPTYSSILREMLEEQIKKPDTSTDPITAVASGAAFYASTLDVSNEIKEASQDKTKIQLDIGYEPSTVETEEWVTLKILPEKTEGDVPEKVLAEIVKVDKTWSSGRIEVDAKGDIFEVKLNEGKPNSFEVLLFTKAGNRLEAQPNAFTIVHGGKVGTATLPYNIGVEVKRQRDGKIIFKTAKGLEVNQSLPAKGTINGINTKKPIRPGNSQDFIKTPIYQGDYYSEGTRAIYNEHVFDVKISGDDLPALLPENSDVDITLTTDKSGRIEKIEAYFPCLNHSAEIAIPVDVMSEIDAEFLDKEILKAKRSIVELKSSDALNIEEVDDIETELDSLKQRLDQERNDYDRKKEILDSLRKSLKKIDELQESNEWPKLEAELKEEFDRIERANRDLGNEKTSQHINQLRNQVDEVIRKKDLKVGYVILEEIRSLAFAVNYKRYKPEILKERLIELYSENPKIPQDKFKALFDELYTFSGDDSLTDENIQRLRAIDKEIDDLI